MIVSWQGTLEDLCILLNSVQKWLFLGFWKISVYWDFFDDGVNGSRAGRSTASDREVFVDVWWTGLVAYMLIAWLFFFRRIGSYESFWIFIWPFWTVTIFGVKNGFVCNRLGSIMTKNWGVISGGALIESQSQGRRVVLVGILINRCFDLVSIEANVRTDGGADCTVQWSPMWMVFFAILENTSFSKWKFVPIKMSTPSWLTTRPET